MKEHMYWIWDLEGEVHSIWDLWICGLQECKGNGFSKSSERATILNGQLPLAKYSSPEKFVGGT